MLQKELKLILFNGNRYEEIIGKDYKEKQRLPHAKVHFEEYIMNIDLSSFNNVDLNQENYTSTFRMQKVDQLNESIDSLERDFKEQKRVFSDNFNKKIIQIYNDFELYNYPLALTGNVCIGRGITINTDSEYVLHCSNSGYPSSNIFTLN